jgi:uncharacterized damage-inducible protein DinB
MSFSSTKRGFLKRISLSSLGILGSFSLFGKNNTPTDQEKQLRNELIEAFQKSETYTLAIIEQMPDDLFGFKYTPEAMSYAEQFRHCAVYTLGQIAGRLKLQNPYENAKPKVDLNKEETIAETKKLYAFLYKTIQELPDERFYEKVDFQGSIPVWRLFYAMENHIIHHRGQAICYLRLKGVTPKGYFGW